MTSCTSSASLCLEALPPLPPTFLDTPEIIEESDITSPLIKEERPPPAKSSWFIDTPDLFVLLCSLLLTAISIVFVTLVLYLQVIQGELTTSRRKTLSFLQRVISSLSVTITSAIIMVAGKRYVLFKLAKGGLRSRRMVVYSNPSIGSLVSYLVFHGAELPLFYLSAVWILGLATSLTVNSSWKLEPISLSKFVPVLSGPLDSVTSSPSLLTQASAQLSYVYLSMCMGLEQEHRLVNITNTTDLLTMVYYPPLDIPSNVGSSFKFPATMNSFNFSKELELSSMPTTARHLSCYDSWHGAGWSLWSNGSNNQTLSIVASVTGETAFVNGTVQNSTHVFLFNATAIVMGGTLSSTGNYVEFSQNGTSWPNIMSNDSQWAEDITSLVCNTTFQAFGNQCQGSSVIDFMNIGTTFTSFYSIMGMALGAYTWAVYANAGHSRTLAAYGAQLTSQYGIYILIPHIVVSLVMLVVVMKLRLASPLGADFINSTQLLLDPLRKPELFNTSLDTTLDVLGDPYIVVGGGELLITQKGRRRGKRRTSCL